MEDTKVGSDPTDEPAQVAKQGIDVLMNDKEVIAGGASTKAQGVAAKVLPGSAEK